MVALIKIDKLTLYGGRVERLNYNKFDFHFVGDYRLYIDRNALPRHQIVARLGKPCQIRHKFDKNAV